MNDLPPEALTAYFINRDDQRAADVASVLDSLTARERGVLHDAAVMGYVQGLQRERSEGVPKDSQIMALVIDACLTFHDLYPTVNAGPPPRPNSTEWVVESRWNDGQWHRWSGLYDTAEEARERFVSEVNEQPPTTKHAFRLIRATTTYTVEGLYDPHNEETPS
ncbi:hypothetical protein [Streptomyces sp. 8L]|uniref:hypothetical protein n=1 Tax=Streptomyces sp. 8L TaxID=2877242 RepID=UPI001CD35131|nr:hypothetical protein [Streptomyces sp. 8L]MCA1222443.1 hypothetical protein [Streptomyces sp. 8L]